MRAVVAARARRVGRDGRSRGLAAAVALIVATGIVQAAVVSSAQAVSGQGTLDRLPALAALDLSPDRFGRIAPLRPQFVQEQANATAATVPKAPPPLTPATRGGVPTSGTTVTVPSSTTTATAPPPTTTTTAPKVTQPRLVVTLTADRSTVGAGDRIEYTIKVRNAGDGDYTTAAGAQAHVPFGTTEDGTIDCGGSVTPATCGSSISQPGSSDPSVHQINVTWVFGSAQPMRPGDVVWYRYRVKVSGRVRSGSTLSNHAHLHQDGAADQTTNSIVVTVA